MKLLSLQKVFKNMCLILFFSLGVSACSEGPIIPYIITYDVVVSFLTVWLTLGHCRTNTLKFDV
jgi:hypothetical protein